MRPRFGRPADAWSTIKSAIPAFSKRGDLLVVDEGCNHIIRHGVGLSRSYTKYFRHNDMKDLERVLAAVVASDRKYDQSLSQRRLIIVEGVYANSGLLCPLPQVVQLAAK